MLAVIDRAYVPAETRAATRVYRPSDARTEEP